MKIMYLFGTIVALVNKFNVVVKWRGFFEVLKYRKYSMITT